MSILKMIFLRMWLNIHYSQDIIGLNVGCMQSAELFLDLFFVLDSVIQSLNLGGSQESLLTQLKLCILSCSLKWTCHLLSCGVVEIHYFLCFIRLTIGFGSTIEACTWGLDRLSSSCACFLLFQIFHGHDLETALVFIWLFSINNATT